MTTEVNSSSAPPAPSSSTSEDDGFTAVNERVTAKTESNLRTVTSSKDDATIVHLLKNGEFAVRTGINKASGWSRLEYNGKTVYAITSYLLTEAEFNAASSEQTSTEN